MAGIDETKAFVPLPIAVLTVSDTRSLTDDRSGEVLAECITTAGHVLVARQIVRDDQLQIVACLQSWIDDPAIAVILTSGGTGLTVRDVTPEAVRRVLEKEIPGFGELFRWLSYGKVGTSTIQSRAMGGIANGTYIFALPGSPSACRDAWDGILRHQLDARYRPCNFVDLLPRLTPPR